MTTRAFRVPADHAVTLVVVGDLDAFTVSAFRTEAALATAPDRPVVVDLMGVPFLDGAGLRALVAFVGRCHDLGLPVATCANPHLARVLAASGFDRLAPLGPSRYAAGRLVDLVLAA
jgi:anti-anti-sigma factor